MRDLATTDDGSVLYFSSTLRFRGSDQSLRAKIFRFANGSYELVAQPTPPTTLPDGSAFQFDSRYPSVSGDGRVVAWDGTATCQGGPSCAGAYKVVSYMLGAPSPFLGGPGAVRISHNGRYALRMDSLQLYDFQTGVFARLDSSYYVAGDGRQSIADDGTVLTVRGLWRSGELQALPLSGSLSGRLSAVGTTAVLGALSDLGCMGGAFYHNCLYRERLYGYSPAGGSLDLELSPWMSQGFGPGASFTPQTYFLPSLSNDGRRLLYRAPGQPSDGGVPAQAVLVNADGTGRRVLTSEAAGIAEAVIAGDGHRAYGATVDGGIVSIDIDAGTVERILPDAPAIFEDAPPLTIVPGSALTLRGRALATSTGQSKVTLAGYSAPVLAASPASVTLQVPWEFDLSRPATLIGADPAGPFERVIPAQAALARPRFLGVLHQDWRGAPTAGDPARPGEILAFFLTGLGPVSPAVKTGRPAPLWPLSRVQLPLACSWHYGELPADVLFAGLMPGEIGVYLAIARVPASDTGSNFGCRVTLPGGGQASSDLIIVPAGAK